MLRGRFADRQVTDARLYPRGASQRVDLQNTIQFAQAQQNALGVGHGAGTQPRSRAPGDHGDIKRMANLQHLLHLFHVFGQHHGDRQIAVHRQGIALIGALGFAFLNDAICAEALA